MDWFDLLAVQGTLKSLLQHHSSKASILQRSALFMVQLSHPYMTKAGKTTALTRRTLAAEWYLCFLCCLGCHTNGDEASPCGPQWDLWPEEPLTAHGQ